MFGSVRQCMYVCLSVCLLPAHFWSAIVLPSAATDGFPGSSRCSPGGTRGAPPIRTARFSGCSSGTRAAARHLCRTPDMVNKWNGAPRQGQSPWSGGLLTFLPLPPAVPAAGAGSELLGGRMTTAGALASRAGRRRGPLASGAARRLAQRITGHGIPDGGGRYTG